MIFQLVFAPDTNTNVICLTSIFIKDIIITAHDAQHRPISSKDDTQLYFIVTRGMAQVLSMWEDTFTGVFKFRARWLIHANDLPKDVLSRLRAARRSFSRSGRPSKGDTQRCDDEVGDEVFLTPITDDLEVRLISRPVTLSVTTSPGTEITMELEGKMGLRLTHTYDDSTGDFVPVDDTDSILKRARVRHSEAVDIAFNENQEHEAAKIGEPVKSTGWLLPKRRIFGRKGRGDISSHYHRGLDVDNGSSSSAISPVRVDSPVSDMDMDISNSSELQVGYNSKNEQWKESDDRDSERTDTDEDLAGSSTQNATVEESFVPRKSTRQQKSQRSSYKDAKVNSVSFVASLCSTPKLSWSSQRRSHLTTTEGARPLRLRPRRDMPSVSEGRQKVAVPVGGHGACIAADNHSKTRQTRSLSIRVSSEAQVKNSRKLPRSSSSLLSSTVKQPTVSGKRRRKCRITSSTSIYANKYFANKNGEKEEIDYPPRQTPVGKKFQALIPELLSCEGKKRPSAGPGAQMVSDGLCSLGAWYWTQGWFLLVGTRGLLANHSRHTRTVQIVVNSVTTIRPVLGAYGEVTCALG